jgi:hypothetical protein
MNILGINAAKHIERRLEATDAGERVPDSIWHLNRMAVPSSVMIGRRKQGYWSTFKELLVL